MSSMRSASSNTSVRSAREVQRALAQQFLDAARRADHDVRSVLQRRQLRAQRHAAAQDRQLQVGDGESQLAQLLADLVGQLAGRAQHQRLRAAHRGIQAMQQAQAEGRGLAAAGRRLRDQVAPVEDRRQAAGPGPASSGYSPAPARPASARESGPGWRSNRGEVRSCAHDRSIRPSAGSTDRSGHERIRRNAARHRVKRPRAWPASACPRVRPWG